MKKKPAAIIAAWIGFSGVIIAAIITGLIYLFSTKSDNENNITNINIDKNNNSPVSGKIVNQTNNYYQTNTNLFQKIELLKEQNTVPPSTLNNKKTKENNKGNNSKLIIENMSGGIAVGNVENLNINLTKESNRETNGIYKNGEKWGVVTNININEEK